MQKKLRKYFHEVIEHIVGHKLQSVDYIDPSNDPAFLVIKDDQKIHVTVEAFLHFEKNQSLSVCWLNEEGWPQYVLGCFRHKQYSDSKDFEMSSNSLWCNYIGKPLTGFDIFGFNENPEEFSINRGGESKAGQERHYVEPHLLKLYFGNEVVAFSNFNYEENLKPTFDSGDDLWVFFDQDKIAALIDQFKFIKL